MKFWVGVTDKKWFNYLASINADEVNFWQPGSTPPTTRLQPGDLFLFKLHSPDNYIVGGGFFVRFTRLPIRLAWEAFGQNNGIQSCVELISRIGHFKKQRIGAETEIGCNVLNAPFYLPRDKWIPVPEDWSPNIVRGKFYDTTGNYGKLLYASIREALEGDIQIQTNDQDKLHYGNFYLTKARLGQGAFRVLVTDAYNRRCAVTNEKTLPALEAAHIKSYSVEGPNHVNNGLLLRADIHRLFDGGYVTIDQDYKFVVSKRVKAEFTNGREYYQYHGNALTNLPSSTLDMPSREFINWHNTTIYAD